MTKKTIGVIGLGSIGMRHAKNLVELGHKVRGYDTDMAKRLKLNGVLYEMDEVLDCDAVVIASPTPDHAAQLHLCAMAGKPCFVEKPVADKMIDVNTAMVGYNLRFHTCVLQAKEWIEKGFLGEPLWANFVVAQYNDKTDYRRDGVILNWSHEIDLALHLLGPADVRSCVASPKEVLADIVLFHVAGCQSTIHLDYVTIPWIRQSVIVGTEATIILDLESRHAWLRSATGQMLDSLVGQDTWDENYKDEMETFIARLNGEDTVGCTGQEGLEVLKICLEAKKLALLQ